MSMLPDVFSYQDRQVRTVTVDGEPWFVAADVCGVLEIGDTRKSVSYLDEDERTTSPVTDSLGREQQTYIVNEPGLYSLILRSRKPEARMFKRWITHEVLPALRKTGSYAVPDKPMSELEMAEGYVAALQRERTLKAELAEAQPKIEAHDAFMDADGALPFSQVAKNLGYPDIGRNKLINILRAEGVLMINREPYQRYAHHFRVITQTFHTPDGREQVTTTTRVKPSGMDLIRRLLAERSAS